WTWVTLGKCPTRKVSFALAGEPVRTTPSATAIAAKVCARGKGAPSCADCLVIGPPYPYSNSGPWSLSTGLATQLLMDFGVTKPVLPAFTGAFSSAFAATCARLGRHPIN